MTKLLKIVAYVVVGLVVVLSVAISLTIGWRPFIGPRARPLTNRTFERTPQRLARGQYLSKISDALNATVNTTGRGMTHR